MDEHRLNAFVGGQLCAAPRPLKELIFYVNQYVSEILEGALDGQGGVVVYGGSS